jgi:exoribonuclease R
VSRPRRRLRPAAAAAAAGVAGAAAEESLSFAAIRRELEVPGAFPDAVLAEAAAAARAGPREDVPGGSQRADLRDLPFVTLDPPGSRDLDQAFHLERRGGGWRVRYAIADVAAFVVAGGAVDGEAWARGTTLYGPDARVPLHPVTLSEGAASLLPGELRPAAVWTIDLDTAGEQVAVDLRRAWVRSTEQLDYPAVQRALDDGSAGEQIVLLAEVGAARTGAERRRGGFDLPVPEQEVVPAPGDPAGLGWTLSLRGPLAVERHNAQLSLLTGMAAAGLMLGAGVGLLRTLPPPEPQSIERLRRTATGLGVAWPADAPLGDVLRGIDASTPAGAAFLEEATELLRGAGYSPFDGAAPQQAVHGALAAPYAHVTAPLRRLADRATTEVCLAAAAGAQPPDWARAALGELPAAMAAASRRAGELERACVDLLEALLLRERVGERFAATVVEADSDRPRATVTIASPPVRARCDGDGLALGAVVDAQLVEADPAQRRVRFVAGDQPQPQRAATAR